MQTNANLSMLPDHVVEGFRALIDDLARVVVNVIRLPAGNAPPSSPGGPGCGAASSNSWRSTPTVLFP